MLQPGLKQLPEAPDGDVGDIDNGLDARTTACIRARADFLLALHGQKPASTAAKKAAYSFFAKTEEHSCRSLG